MGKAGFMHSRKSYLTTHTNHTFGFNEEEVIPPTPLPMLAKLALSPTGASFHIYCISAMLAGLRLPHTARKYPRLHTWHQLTHEPQNPTLFSATDPDGPQSNSKYQKRFKLLILYLGIHKKHRKMKEETGRSHRMSRGGWIQRDFIHQVEPRVLMENAKNLTATPVGAN